MKNNKYIECVSLNDVLCVCVCVYVLQQYICKYINNK